MRHSLALLFTLTALGITPALAFEINPDSSFILNKVTTRFSAEQYVATKTALVTVSINAGVNDAGLQTIQDEVLKKLNDLSNKGEWHIISFDRSLDQSGLEKVVMQGQARLPSSALSNLRDKAKSMSKPGETFTLDNVEFTPSEQELRDANTTLRGQIYQQAKDEIDRLDKAYPDQKFYMHEVSFLNSMVPGPMMPMQAMAMVKMGNNNSDAGNSLAVGNKLIINATVMLAAIPDAAAKLATHP
jgi:hypothetical protein